MTERAPLRDRLLALRADLLHQLDGADVLEPGWLNTLAGIAAALDGFDNADPPGTTEPMARAVVTDVPGSPMVLTMYGDDGRAVSVELTAIRAITLAGRLIDAASRRLR